MIKDYNPIRQQFQDIRLKMAGLETMCDSPLNGLVENIEESIFQLEETIILLVDEHRQLREQLPPNLTYHIIPNGLYAPNFNYDHCFPDNIILEASLFPREYYINELQPVIPP